MAAATQPLSKDEQRLLMARLPSEPARDRALIMTLLHLALRVTSTLSVTVGHVFDGTRIRQAVTVERKRMKYGSGVRRRSVSGRTLVINGALARALSEYLELRMQSGPLHIRAPLFPSRQGDAALSRWQANRIIHRVFAAAGIPDRGCHGCHTLRKTGARLAFEFSNYNVLAVKYLLGHASLESTCAYLADDHEAAFVAMTAMGGCVGEAGRGALGFHDEVRGSCLSR